MLTVLHARHDFALGRAVAGQLICNYHAECAALTPQQLAQQALGGLLIAPALQQYVQYDPVLIHRTPQPVLHAGDLHCDLVQVPFVANTWQSAPDLAGNSLAELEAPLP